MLVALGLYLKRITSDLLILREQISVFEFLFDIRWISLYEELSLRKYGSKTNLLKQYFKILI